jgi:cell wall-associated NlpC family hydrolase
MRGLLTPRRSAPAYLVGLVAGLLLAGSATAEPTQAERKQAEADRVLAEIRSIDSSVEKAAEAYNLANLKLDEIEREQRANARLLKLARGNLARANETLELRLVALYTSGGDGSALEVILGARSLDDLLNRIETADRVSALDARVLGQVRQFRGAVQKRRAELARARTQQERIVAERAAHQAEVERRLRERQRLLASIKDEIARIEAAERRRSLAAAQATRARIQAQPELYTIQEESPTPPVDGATGSAPPTQYGGVVGIAMQYLGIPYRWGGSSPSGFDCSGFVMFVYAQVGVSLPHNAAAQFAYGTPVSRDELQPGDLVFFDGLGHNGIYVGGGNFIHSPHTGDVVKISSLFDSWYDSRWVGGRRL